MLIFILGFIIGGITGTGAMALLQAKRAAGIVSTALMSRALSYIERTEKAIREGSEKE